MKNSGWNVAKRHLLLISESSSSRPQEDGVKLHNNVHGSGENKENFMTDDKSKCTIVT